MNEPTVPSPLFPAPPVAPPPVIPEPSTDPLAKVMLTRGFEIFKRAWGPIMVSILCMIVAQVPVQVLSFMVNLASIPTRGGRPAPGAPPEFTPAMAAMMVFSWIYGFLVVMPMAAGSVMLVVRISRGRPVEWADLLCGFRRFVPVVLAGFLQSLALCAAVFAAALVIALVAWIVGQVAQGFVLIAVIAPLVLVGLLFAIWLSVRLYPSVFVAADPEMPRISATQALARSWEITGGNVTHLVVGMLIAGLIAIASILLLCVGYLLVGVPYLAAVTAVAYDELTRRARRTVV